jgi:Rhodopirellula transposase DDE domain
MEALEALVDPATRGDPESPLRWTCKSARTLARELTAQGHPVSYTTVGQLLRQAGYSLQGNRKTKEGDSHPDCNTQFEHINAMVKRFQKHGQPVISVDTKKKEIVGNFKNGGREWMPQGQPDEVRVHHFIDKTLGKAIPYGVYDITNNQGWVSVGIDHDTAQFAAGAIYRWSKKMGRKLYPDAPELLITADDVWPLTELECGAGWVTMTQTRGRIHARARQALHTSTEGRHRSKASHRQGTCLRPCGSVWCSTEPSPQLGQASPRAS